MVIRLVQKAMGRSFAVRRPVIPAQEAAAKGRCPQRASTANRAH
jgi:hypothetical protein